MFSVTKKELELVQKDGNVVLEGRTAKAGINVGDKDTLEYWKDQNVRNKVSVRVKITSISRKTGGKGKSSVGVKLI